MACNRYEKIFYKDYSNLVIKCEKQDKMLKEKDHIISNKDKTIDELNNTIDDLNAQIDK